MNLVSIVITNYNYGKFLSTAIESLVKQTHNRLELIIIDDGSEDGSREIIESLKALYKDRFERFESLLLRQNRGSNHALNKGLIHVRGEITINLDADDYLDQDYVRETVRMLLASNAKNKKTVFVYTDCWLVDSTNNLLTRGRSTSFDKELLQTSSYIPTCAATFTSVLQDALPFNENIEVGNKHHKWMKIVNAGWDGLYLEKPLFYYRMHEQNLSGIGRRVLFDLKKAYPKMCILSGYWQTTNLNEGVK